MLPQIDSYKIIIESNLMVVKSRDSGRQLMSPLHKINRHIFFVRSQRTI